MAKLWPLALNKNVKFTLKRGDEVFDWEFTVPVMEWVETPIGRHLTYVVQGVMTPKLVHHPKTAAMVMNTGIMRQNIAAVVRFRTRPT